MPSTTTEEVARIRRRLAAIDDLLSQAERQLGELATDAPEPVAQAAAPVPRPVVPPPPVAIPIAPTSAPASGGQAPGVARMVATVGVPRLLAIAGGVALLAGLVFLYVLASQNGVLGPAGRVLIGGVASAALVGAGLWLERRRPGLIAAQAAAGAGVAGLYVAVVSASRRYELVEPEVALVMAALVAAAAVAIATRWRSELIAVLGIVGALIAPPTLDAGLSAPGVAFVILLSAASAALWIRHGWNRLAGAVAAISAVYALALVGGAFFEDVRDLGWNPYWQAVAGVAAFWALLTATWVARTRRGIDGVLNVRILLGGGALALIAARVMFDGDAAGAALVFVAAVHIALAIALRLAGGARRASLMLAAALVGSAALALATLALLDGASLVVALALEGVVIAALALRERSGELEAAAFAHVGIAGVAMFADIEPVRSLFEYPPAPLLNAAGTALAGGPAIGAIVSLLATAVGAAIVAAAHQRRSDDPIPALPWVAAGAGLLAVAGTIVDVALLVDLSRDSFQFAHVVVSGVWALAALGALWVGLTRARTPIRVAGLALLGLTVAKLVLYDLSQLTALARVSSFIVVGALLIVGSIVYQRLARGGDGPGRAA